MKGDNIKNKRGELNCSENFENLNDKGDKLENLNILSNLGIDLNPDVINAFINGYDKTVKDFKTEKEGFESQYKYHIRKEGIISPNDFSDFIFWYEELYPDHTFNDIQYSLKDTNLFKKFHEYKVRKLNNENWSIIDEVKFVNNESEKAKELRENTTFKSENGENLSVDELQMIVDDINKDLGKSWQDRNKELLDYIYHNVTNVPAKKMTLERAEQLDRNLSDWYENIRVRLPEEIEMLEHLKNTLSNLNKKIIFLKNQNTESIPAPQHKKEAESQISTLKNEIESAFSFMQNDDPNKHKQILSNDDFDSLMKWVNYYFENNFTIPEIDNPIKVINTNKGNVIYTFKKIFKELHPTKTRPDSLFELIKLCFYNYREDNIENHKKQKEPQYYSQLIIKK